MLFDEVLELALVTGLFESWHGPHSKDDSWSGQLNDPADLSASEKVENGYFALVLTVVISLLAIAFVAVTLSFSKGYQRASQDSERQHAKRSAAEVKYRECRNAAASLDSVRDCVIESRPATREAERAKQDLNAQREMADWAEGMLWAAWAVGLLTIFATIIGVRYVYLTLIATRAMASDTRRMAEDTRDIGEAQVRACVSFDVKAYTFEHTKDLGNGLVEAKIGLLGDIMNYGQSPAYEPSVKAFFKMVTADYRHTITGDELFQTKKTGTFIPAGQGIRKSLTKRFEVDTEAMKRGELLLSFLVGVEYTDVFNHRPEPYLVSGFVSGLLTDSPNILWSDFERPDE